MCACQFVHIHTSFAGCGILKTEQRLSKEEKIKIRVAKSSFKVLELPTTMKSLAGANSRLCMLVLGTLQ